MNLGWIKLISASYEIVLDESTLVQVMACSLTDPSHYLSQCWLRSMSPHGVIEPRWVNDYISLVWSNLSCAALTYLLKCMTHSAPHFSYTYQNLRTMREVKSLAISLDWWYGFLFSAREDTLLIAEPIMTSSNGNIFRVTGHLCGEFTGPRWIPRTKASDAELWYFLWSVSE